MDYYDTAREYAGDVGKQAGFGFFCLLSVVMISYHRGIPPSYVWLACGLLGLVAYALIGIGARTWAIARITAYPEPTELPLSISNVSAAETNVLWRAQGVDWLLLLRHLQQPDPPLSRTALVEAGIVNQRAYSPVDGSPSFPERMVALGAAIRIANGNGQPSYVWSPDAKRVVRESLTVSNAAAIASPRPIGQVTG